MEIVRGLFGIVRVMHPLSKIAISVVVNNFILPVSIGLVLLVVLSMQGIVPRNLVIGRMPKRVVYDFFIGVHQIILPSYGKEVIFNPKVNGAVTAVKTVNNG